jgi:hypothetical protein
VQFAHRGTEHFVRGLLIGPGLVAQDLPVDDLAVLRCKNPQDPDLVESEGMGATVTGDAAKSWLNDPVAQSKPTFEVAGVHDHPTVALPSCD